MKGDRHRQWPRKATRRSVSEELVLLAGTSGDSKVDQAVQRVASSMDADVEPTPSDMGVVILRLLQVAKRSQWALPEEGSQPVESKLEPKVVATEPSPKKARSAFRERIRSHDEESEAFSDQGGRRRRGR
jgi:hypothetical protein